MINYYCIVSVFVIECGFGTVEAFRISTEKEIVNHYWIVYVLGLRSVLGI